MPELKIVFSRYSPVADLKKIKIECNAHTNSMNSNAISTALFPKYRVNVIYPIAETTTYEPPEPSTR